MTLPALGLAALLRNPTVAGASTRVPASEPPQPEGATAVTEAERGPGVGVLADYTCPAPSKFRVRVYTRGGSWVYLEPPSGSLIHSRKLDNPGDPDHRVYQWQTHDFNRSGTYWVGVNAYDGPLGPDSRYQVLCRK